MAERRTTCSRIASPPVAGAAACSASATTMSSMRHCRSARETLSPKRVSDVLKGRRSTSSAKDDNGRETVELYRIASISDKNIRAASVLLTWSAVS